MAKMNPVQPIILLALGALLFASPSSAQMSKKDQRAFRERGSDSAWFYNPFMGRPRFYLGTTRVSGTEFENTLRSSDAEVDQLMNGAWRNVRTAGYLSIGAGALVISGALLLNSYDNRIGGYSSNQLNPTGLVLLGAGVVLEGFALGFSINGSNRFRSGMRVFNQKAKSGQLRPAQVRVGSTNHGLGLAINF
jgi:hypothetical protein